MSKHFNSLKYLRIHFSSKNIRVNRKNLGMAIGFGISSSINGLDETPRWESSSLSPICSIEMETCYEAASLHEVRSSCNAYYLIFIECFRCHHASMEVHRAHLKI